MVSDDTGQWTILSNVGRKVGQFFGIWDARDLEQKHIWVGRRLRLAEHSYGGVIGIDAVDAAGRGPQKPSLLQHALTAAGIKAVPQSRSVGGGRQIVTSRLLSSGGDAQDNRPYFTYWLTTVQIAIMVITLCWYGFAPFDIDLTQTVGYVRTESLVFEQISVVEASNFWLGPRPADLIHLGAKFTPCMRSDPSIMAKVEAQNLQENLHTGCCVRNDGSGCLQTTQDRCSPLLSTFHKWNGGLQNDEGRTAGPVCGQDPRYCQNPQSLASNVWPDDLRRWPVCRVSLHQAFGLPKHMSCKPTARPCCVGIHGRCEMRSEEYCSFVRGHFHPEATLCSQVSCMQDVCGMLSFANPGAPDQFYRLWTPVFLHAGIVHLVVSIFVQVGLMRDVERVIGSIRVAIIFFGSALMGNIASAVFTPYRAESGPSGAHFGLLATLLVEVINAWPVLKQPGRAIGKLLGVLFILLLAGFLPWVDNYAHIFGFVEGLLLSLGLIPHTNFIVTEDAAKERKGRVLTVCLSLTLAILLVVSFVIIFYLNPFGDCPYCSTWSCIPLTSTFCSEHYIDLSTETRKHYF